MYYEFTDGLSEEEFEDELGEMAHLWTKYSRLPYRVMIDHDGIRRKRENNSPRIMISLDKHCKNVVSVSIEKDNPEVLIDKEVPEFEIIKEWIKFNYKILMKHWNREIDDLDTLFLLKERSCLFYENYLSVRNG